MANPNRARIGAKKNPKTARNPETKAVEESKPKGKSITIRGTKFIILSSTTIAEHMAQGRPQLAKHLREQKIKRTLGLQKPNGRRVFMSEEFDSGRFSTPRQVG